ncbi:MAG: helix-turn-helix domain-containing protein [Microlunatus sp.]
MTVQQVEAAAEHLREAEQQLREAARAAQRGGVPMTRIARAAGVSAATLYRWLGPGKDARGE